MPDCGRTTAGMANRASQKPAEYEKAGLKLVQKTQELMQRTGGHALAMFADSKHQCQFFATEALQTVATDREAIQFFGKQLVQNLHPNQFVVPRCITAPPSKAALSYLPQSRDRKDSWKERASTLQALAQTMAQAHADKAFFLFLEGGPNLQTIQEAAPKVHGIFQDPGWTQHVLQHIKRASVPARPSASIAPPAASRPAATKKRPSASLRNPDETARLSIPTQRRKVVAASTLEPGTLDWYSRKLSADPATYMTPLCAGAWALPDINVHQRKINVRRPVQVKSCCYLELLLRHLSLKHASDPESRRFCRSVQSMLTGCATAQLSGNYRAPTRRSAPTLCMSAPTLIQSQLEQAFLPLLRMLWCQSGHLNLQERSLMLIGLTARLSQSMLSLKGCAAVMTHTRASASILKL